MENVKETVQEANERAFKKIKEEVERIKYGSVTAVIQEGRIIQIDTNTKIRLT